jgi:superfamily II DNA/RNA helicase
MPPIAKGIIFVDDKLVTSDLAEHLNDCCPEELRGTRPFRHFHSGMSVQYLDEMYTDFEKPDGAWRVLVATSAAAVVS